MTSRLRRAVGVRVDRLLGGLLVAVQRRLLATMLADKAAAPATKARRWSLARRAAKRQVGALPWHEIGDHYRRELADSPRVQELTKEERP